MKTTTEVFYNNFGDIFLDALDSDVPPKEIYEQIKKVVEENYYYHKHLCSRAYEFLALLNDNDKIDAALQEREHHDGPNNDWNDFFGENYYPEENKKTYDEIAADGWTMTADGFWIKEDKQSTNKWILPVELDGLTGDCFINLPDDLLDKAGWKENDQLEWIDRGDGSFELRKV